MQMSEQCEQKANGVKRPVLGPVFLLVLDHNGSLLFCAAFILKVSFGNIEKNEKTVRALNEIEDLIQFSRN